jgi:hypothetical protein
LQPPEVLSLIFLGVGEMTTWLEFRSEPMSEVPEVEIQETGIPGKFFVLCDDMECPVNLDHFTHDEAVDEVQRHKQWHEDGMPQ